MSCNINCSKCNVEFSKELKTKKSGLKCPECFKKSESARKKLCKENNKIKERLPLRKEFFEIVSAEAKSVGDELTQEHFDKRFVTFEKFEEMKKDPKRWSFCEYNEYMKELEKVKYAKEYEKKYFLKSMMCIDNKNGNGYNIFII